MKSLQVCLPLWLRSPATPAQAWLLPPACAWTACAGGMVIGHDVQWALTISLEMQSWNVVGYRWRVRCGKFGWLRRTSCLAGG